MSCLRIRGVPKSPCGRLHSVTAIPLRGANIYLGASGAR
jgi:hypothetical protein